MTEHLVEVEPGVRLFVQDAGSGPAVVLLHGWGLGHEVWDRQVHSLVRAGRRTLAFDLRGHGSSSKPFDGYEVEQLAGDVIAALDRLEVTRATFVGWSLGGLTSFRVATSRPDLVDRLVLVCSNGVAASRRPGLPFGLPAEQVERPLLDAELADRVASREQQIRSGFAREPSEATLHWLVGLAMRMPSWSGMACLRTLLRTDQVAALPGLQAPLVQIVGEADPVLSRRAAAWLLEQVPGAQQVEVAAAGHFPMLEAPEPFDAALLDAVAAT